MLRNAAYHSLVTITTIATIATIPTIATIATIATVATLPPRIPIPMLTPGGEAFAEAKRRKEMCAALTASLRKEQLRSWTVRLSGWYVSELPTAYVKADLDGVCGSISCGSCNGLVPLHVPPATHA